MGHERWFRGQHDGQGRPFDWLTPARQHGIPDDLAWALYERAMQQANGASQGRVQELYQALLTDADRDASRPSPGKVTRTMRLQGEKAGSKRRTSSLSTLTGQPIASGRVPLTSYIEPAHGRRNGTQVSEKLIVVTRTASQFSETEETDAEETMRLYEASMSVAGGQSRIHALLCGTD